MENNTNLGIQEAVKQQRRLFGLRLRTLRESAGLTQQQLGDSAGFTASVIARYEAGGSLPRPKSLEKLAAALGVSVSDLEGKNFSLDFKIAFFDFLKRRLKLFNIQAEYKDKVNTVTLTGPDISEITMSYDELQDLVENTEKETNKLLRPLFNKYFYDLFKANLETMKHQKKNS